MSRFALFPSIGEYPVYDDAVYDAFDAADDRCHAYRTAIRGLAPGRCVVDIGTGRDALWAIEAANSQARHVYAVEALPSAAASARKAVARAGVADRVTVVEGRSTAVSLPVRADLCVSEIVGNIASAEGAVAVLDDARRRLCAPGCAWIPVSCATRCAAVDLRPTPPVEAGSYLDRILSVTDDPRMCLAGPVEELIISTPGTLESLCFGAAPAPYRAVSEVLTVTRPWSRLTGVLLWVTVSCPGTPDLDALARGSRGWAPVYVPLAPEGIPVRPGDEVTIRFTSTTSDDATHPDYRIDASLLASTATWHSPHHRRQP